MRPEMTMTLLESLKKYTAVGAVATEKLAEGIRKFNSDARHLEDFALSQVAQKVG
jgi:transaldolase